ncbi:hypothetical protein CRM22_002022 [Opisthorchis felineus]|uniref:Uncharacterized protein n=1 Tax=Opisthorchis felineus TaxID=147828 RepID=A0A4S2M8D1_OPIFE|nr:hypothetical protein CRM22_002022 [Opisthorchis felineus]
MEHKLKGQLDHQGVPTQHNLNPRECSKEICTQHKSKPQVCNKILPTQHNLNLRECIREIYTRAHPMPHKACLTHHKSQRRVCNKTLLTQYNLNPRECSRDLCTHHNLKPRLCSRQANTQSYLMLRKQCLTQRKVKHRECNKDVYQFSHRRHREVPMRRIIHRQECLNSVHIQLRLNLLECKHMLPTRHILQHWSNFWLDKPQRPTAPGGALLRKVRTPNNMLAHNQSTLATARFHVVRQRSIITER